MQCERLIKMIKSWYLHVRDETMAPARMISFIEDHAENCDVCLQDPDLRGEIAKITELILPESKIPKAVRLKNSDDDEVDTDEEIDVDEVDDEESDGSADDEEEVEDEAEDEDDLDLDDDDLMAEDDEI
jgi:hypothetical protein